MIGLYIFEIFKLWIAEVNIDKADAQNGALLIMIPSLKLVLPL